MGMPRYRVRYGFGRAFTLYTQLHQISTVGSYILALGMLLPNLIQSMFAGKKSPANPWGGVSMEWETATPPIEHNPRTTCLHTGAVRIS